MSTKHQVCNHQQNISMNRSKGPLPEIYNKSSPILPEIGFRIAAIREAFEESGLLIAQNFPLGDLSQHQLSEWQHAVHQDGSQVRLQQVMVCEAIF